MKALVVVDENSSVDDLLAHLAKRFPGGKVDLEVLYIEDSSALAGGSVKKRIADVASLLGRDTSTQKLQPAALVQKIEASLRDQGFRSVRTHIQRGDPVEHISTSCEKWHIVLLLIEAPKRHWLVNVWSNDVVPKRLLGQVDCNVELVRDSPGARPDALSVLAAIDVNALNRYPFTRLKTLPWRPGATLHLLGVLPSAVSDTTTEANPAAVIRSLKSTDRAAALALSELHELQRQLEQILPANIRISAEVVAGSPREVVVDHARSVQPSWIAIASVAGSASAPDAEVNVSAVDIALAASCSVLILKALDSAVDSVCSDAPRRVASY